MNITDALALTAQLKAASLIDFPSSYALHVSRYTDPQGQLVTNLSIILHGDVGVAFAEAQGGVFTAWICPDRPQRACHVTIDGIDFCAIEVAPEGAKLVEGQLVFPQAA